MLSLKLSGLLALVSGQRVQTLAAISVENIKYSKDIIRIFVPARLKSSDQGLPVFYMTPIDGGRRNAIKDYASGVAAKRNRNCMSLPESEGVSPPHPSPIHFSTDSTLNPPSWLYIRTTTRILYDAFRFRKAHTIAITLRGYAARVRKEKPPGRRVVFEGKDGRAVDARGFLGGGGEKAEMRYVPAPDNNSIQPLSESVRIRVANGGDEKS
ncbi:hypothetical protein Fcan01_12416 [Folsomia candida]|uniref:Uncharacterized protein n=1 Tax=Folsomia candida TaxID=158441 RepID=A0A226E7X2_FOLCA|nr:hypothetical protein Fcan01_12416 [Folsomia candida]